jgi:hypothetical protein
MVLIGIDPYPNKFSLVSHGTALESMGPQMICQRSPVDVVIQSLLLGKSPISTR